MARDELLTLARKIKELPREEYPALVAQLPEDVLQLMRDVLWDKDIERDSAGGALDYLIEEALAEDARGETKSL